MQESKKTCARCHNVADQCIGNSNSKLCEETDGEKIILGKVWKDNLDLVNYVEWNVERVNCDAAEYIDNLELKDNEEDEAGNISNCDEFLISNCDEEASTDDIKK